MIQWQFGKGWYSLIENALVNIFNFSSKKRNFDQMNIYYMLKWGTQQQDVCHQDNGEEAGLYTFIYMLKVIFYKKYFIVSDREISEAKEVSPMKAQKLPKILKKNGSKKDKASKEIMKFPKLLVRLSNNYPNYDI